MAFLRFASAREFHQVSHTGWSRVRAASTQTTAPLSTNLLDQASEILQQKFDPDDYLLTHATLVASVDTYDVSNVKLGNVVEGARKVNRKFSNFRIRPECDPWINNNNDSWERRVLMKSYPTLIGGHNFVEHVQIEEQSKGRIIDACPRDIGDSVYVDILMATDRKHKSLIASIQSGEMNSLSMGCSIDFSQCTKCGHVAIDDADMCQHVRYEKGNYFYDEEGRRHRVAELCGHHSVDPTGGVRFIEGSWVRIPAFGGAVLRTILTPQEVTADNLRKAQAILMNPPAKWTEESLQGIAKAAALIAMAKKADFDFGGGDDDIPADEDAGGKGKDETLLPELEEEAKQQVLRNIKQRLRDEISPKKKVDLTQETNLDENINRQASQSHRYRIASIYRDSIGVLVKCAKSDVALMNGVASINSSFGIKVPVDVYRAALRVGSTTRYSNLNAFIRACEQTLGRTPTFGESRTLVRLGNLLAHLSG